MRAALAGALVATVCAAAAGATEWVVDDDGPADFHSIQAAINAPYVVSGDSVLVRPGTYRETLYLSSKDLAIRSERGPFVTLVDAGGSGSVVSLVERGTSTRIEGFTLRNGSDQTGGGIWILHGSPVITRNVIEGNEATGGALGYGYGGGIEIYSASPVITRNVIQGNTALDGGGAIDVYYSGPNTPGSCCPVIAQNTIVGNTVTAAAGKGGGILSFASEPRIASSILWGNGAARGGGLYVERVQGNSDAPQATTNIFFQNVPDASDSSGPWQLPASNIHADPHLGPGERSDLWPRSSSPALDAAEAGLPPGSDLAGTPGARDGDVDGSVVPDIGALEGLGEITSLSAVDDTLLTWDPSANPDARFNVYRSDGAPFVTDGGVCRATLLPAPSFSEPAVPSPGGIFFYVVTAEDAGEGSRGRRSDGTDRPALPSCSGP